MAFGLFEVGATIVVSERWHGLLWSAVPARVVASSAEEIVAWVPAGTVGTYATNRDLPEAQGLPRNRRKLLALRTRNATVAEVAETPDKLLIRRRGRWSGVNLGWEPGSRRFLGWYVNFEVPARTTATGLVSMDLVLDLWVEPTLAYTWKDRDDFEAAVGEGILGPRIRSLLAAETTRVLTEREGLLGPFGPGWRSFQPDPAWPTPELPAAFAWGGAAWSLPPGRRHSPPA